MAVALREILPKAHEHHREIIGQAMSDLYNYDLMQPEGAPVKGAQKRSEQWRGMAGGLVGKPSTWKSLAGAAAGAAAGLILGLNVQSPVIVANLAIPGALAGIFAGLYGGRQLGRAGDYRHGMMLVIVNERESAFYPEEVSSAARIWIPKPLLAWRAHDWSYKDGAPFLNLMLPLGERIEERLFSTLDYLQLPVDEYRALDAAVYDQRSDNRLIANSAQRHKDWEDSNKPQEDPWGIRLPFIISGGAMLLGVMMVVMTTG